MSYYNWLTNWYGMTHFQALQLMSWKNASGSAMVRPMARSPRMCPEQKCYGILVARHVSKISWSQHQFFWGGRSDEINWYQLILPLFEWFWGFQLISDIDFLKVRSDQNPKTCHQRAEIRRSQLKPADLPPLKMWTGDQTKKTKHLTFWNSYAVDLGNSEGWDQTKSIETSWHQDFQLPKSISNYQNQFQFPNLQLL